MGASLPRTGRQDLTRAGAGASRNGSARSDRSLGPNAVSKMLAGHASYSRCPTGDDHASAEHPAAEAARKIRLT
jgi:hypothetical protein